MSIAKAKSLLDVSRRGAWNDWAKFLPRGAIAEPKDRTKITVVITLNEP